MRPLRPIGSRSVGWAFCGDTMTERGGAVVYRPSSGHACAPPRYRPESEWDSMPVPPGWVKPGTKPGRLTRPTQYPPDTVWLCSCGQGWIMRRGRRYGSNPNFGWTEGSWTPVAWFHRRIRKAIAQFKADEDYRRDSAIVSQWSAPAVSGNQP